MSADYMMPHSECPFCASENLRHESGKTICLDCLAEYEIDKKSDCIFADADNTQLPLKGTVCPHCGLLQGMDSDKCRLCGTPISCDQR